jgi:hypothetical protein
LTRWRIDDKCTLGGYGVWRVDHFAIGSRLIWISPVDDEAKTLANLAEDGTVGVTANELNPLPELGDTLL